MSDLTVSERMADQRGLHERLPYLATHRALGACTRELVRLTDAVIADATQLATALGAAKPVVRNPPGRCLVQLGPVALTVVWLRSSPESASTGELLVGVWRGAVAPRMHHRRERPGQERQPAPATLLWERVFTAEAESDITWQWRHAIADLAPVTSSALSELCIAQLGQAYAAHSTEVQP